MKQQKKNNFESERSNGLSDTDKEFLCLLLLGYSPKKIADIVKREEKGVSADLSKHVYPYVYYLLEQKNKIDNWRDVEKFIGLAGYRIENQTSTDQILPTNETSSSDSSVSTVSPNAPDNTDNKSYRLITEAQTALKNKIYEKCGKMRVLTMKEPIQTLDVYVNLDIYSENNKHRLYLDNPLSDELVKLHENKQPHSQRLIVVGSTGTGKTMLLRRLALSCFQETSPLKDKRHLPIYIRLRDYAEEEISEIEQYIVREYNINSSDIELLSQTGQLLILIDGFDSRESNSKNVYSQINRFIEKFPNNDYIISCKAEERIFERFEKVELSPLDFKQIRSLVENRIKVKSPNLSKEQKNDLLAAIKDDKHLFEIAQNPLLLVLICLTYAERGSEGLRKEKWKVIYEAIFVILEGWDREQDITYETETNFSKRDKAKFLSFVAFRLIKSGKDSFNQETLEEYISEHITNMLSTHPNLNSQKLYTPQDIFTSLESEHTLLIRRSDLKYEFPKIIFKDFFAMNYIRSEFKSLEKFKSQDILREYPDRWKRFLEVAESAYPIIFEDAI